LQTDLQPVKQKHCLKKFFFTKKGWKWSKNLFGTIKNASPFYVKKTRLSPLEAKGYVVQFFLQKRTAKYTHQSAIREAPTVFSRLPSLMAADKP
jgi:hypothetical protein